MSKLSRLKKKNKKKKDLKRSDIMECCYLENYQKQDSLMNAQDKLKNEQENQIFENLLEIIITKYFVSIKQILMLPLNAEKPIKIN